MTARLRTDDYVRRWDRHGYVMDGATHYAVIEWESGEIEEVEQLDTSVEVVQDGDPLEAEIESLEAELSTVEGVEAEIVEKELRELDEALDARTAARAERYRTWLISKAAPPTPPKQAATHQRAA